VVNYSTLGHNLKRGIFNFCDKISSGFYRPAQKFITEMIYGLISGQSCFLTEIARKLNEKISLDKTVERLSRNLMRFDGADILRESYFEAVKKHFDDSAILIIDEIQKVGGWSSIVKLLWDEDSRMRVPLKVVLTGSSSLLLQKGLAESLLGRFEILFSPHWNYAECKEAFSYSLDDFLLFGGYPGAATLIKDENRWGRYMGSSIVEPTISQDILLMEEVRKPALLRSLFMLGSRYSAQELSFTKMLGQLQDAGNTVRTFPKLPALYR